MDCKLSRKLHSIPPNERIAWIEAVARRCPQWHSCSAPLCPLDPLYHERRDKPDDPRCRALKSTRLRIVEECTAEGVDTVHYLVAGGLTPQEVTRQAASDRGRARWEAMTPEEQEAALARLASARKASN